MLPEPNPSRAPRPPRPRHLGVLAVGAALALSLSACAADGDAPGGNASEDAPLVLTTFTVLADMAQNVAGDHVRVESIIKPGAEVHGYEPTPGDIRRASRADLVLDNGLGLEAWFEQFVADLDVPRVVLTEEVEPIDITGDVAAGLPNPHAWMSAVEAQRYVDAIVDALSALDPTNAEEFAANGAAYSEELAAVHQSMVERLVALPENQRTLVTCEGAFSYLARDAGLDEVYLWPVNAEQQSTPRQVVEVIELVERDEVPAVFCESTVSDAAMRQVAEATGAELGGVLYVDSLSEPDGPVPTYLDLLRHDADVIVEGLTGEPAGDRG
ncbi:metal ABC transporter substrate-binding protein [Actinotalea sp. BY-33]|uniref:Metal ABC transporter substrate-binding protein n=1 Tax=Actinotalea soli TaxID=2819234 RepID=A0A939RTT2_9CELL|nr:metal ABC transporter substrate-binding protein [Actinotalea soli]MBO1751704.1 metal ABC transporter substrate-binding protein [Actinotalea soli]